MRKPAFVQHAWQMAKTFQISRYQLGLSYIVVLCLVIVVSTIGPSLKAQSYRNIKDSDITEAVNRNLLVKEEVSAHLVDVRTQNGIVTLSGTVDNLLAKHQATTIAESIKGVRAVLNQLTVVPVKRPDHEIESDIRKAFSLDPATEASEIDARVSNGKVALTGTVDSWPERRLATAVARGVKGVKEVINEITISYKENRTDEEIAADVKGRLELDPYVAAEAVLVQVQDGKVSLEGAVGSAAEKSSAAMDAWVAGVKDVDLRNLEVKWWMRDEPGHRSKLESKSDARIGAAVRDALLYDPRVFSEDIRVTVQNGTATLAGAVDNLQAKRAAGRDARHTVGVWRVKNNIQVRPPADRADQVIAENVREALLWDPIVERFAIDVSVRNKKVYLKGTVDSAFARQHAEDVTSRIIGVAEVQNNLTVIQDWEWKSDPAIKEDIESELFWSPFVDSDDISVGVENGVATLEGMVEDISELRAAVDNAFEGGPRIVRTRLRIRDEPVDYPAEYHHKEYYSEPLRPSY